MFGPNITGSVKNSSLYDHDESSFRSPTGAFSVSGEARCVDDEGGVREEGGATLTFRASASSSIYGGSASVQPASLRLIPCLKF